jgi:hypothetical protein
MSDIPHDDNPGFVAEEPEHCLLSSYAVSGVEAGANALARRTHYSGA